MIIYRIITRSNINQLKIISKSATIEPTRNYQQSPLVIVSENFDCVDEVITLQKEVLFVKSGQISACNMVLITIIMETRLV